MGKPGPEAYRRFLDLFERANDELGLKQYAVPYLMSSHPGSTLDDAIALAEAVRDMGYMPEQVSDFYPTPSTLSTVMWCCGVDPRTMEPVYVARDDEERAMQRALIQYRDPKNYEIVRKALLKAHRGDLIGYGPRCLIRPDGPWRAPGRREQAERGAARRRAAERRQAGPRPEEGRRQPGRWQPERRAARRRQAGRRQAGRRQQARRSVERRGTRRELRAEVARRARWTLTERDRRRRGRGRHGPCGGRSRAVDSKPWGYSAQSGFVLVQSAPGKAPCLHSEGIWCEQVREPFYDRSSTRLFHPSMLRRHFRRDDGRQADGKVPITNPRYAERSDLRAATDKRPKTGI